ncbi:MAG TPA: TetR/AcrR family transcriptional regulator [Thermoanaerobaculia bacterium]|nr:TetR/AcrR family transcriptional regulator [Thermoanaerobaculia bacterium]
MKGTRTRQSILDRAVDLASVEGLEGLTIGRLAEDLGMSKSGLFAHFGSKEELQLATVEAAQQRFLAEAFLPALKAERGYARLHAICMSWVSYVRRNVFPGGCFFAAASFEFDGRPGLVRNAIVKAMEEWVAAIERAIVAAQELGELDAEIEPAQLAFELNSLFFGVNFSYQLRRDRKALMRAEKAIETRLEGLRIVKPARRLRSARR